MFVLRVVTCEIDKFAINHGFSPSFILADGAYHLISISDSLHLLSVCCCLSAAIF